MSTTYEVYYFSSQGRAETIRLLLALAGQPFTERHVVREQWAEEKPHTPLGQVPVLVERDERGERHIPQSQAILRHLARKFDLYGQTEDDRVQADVVADTVLDITPSFSPLLMGPLRGNAEAIAKYVAEQWPQNAAKLDKLLKRRPAGDGPFFVCGTPTFADIAVYQSLHAHFALVPTILDGHVALRRFYDAMEALPALQERLRTRPPHDGFSLRAGKT